MLHDKPRTATIITTKNSTFLTLAREHFEVIRSIHSNTMDMKSHHLMKMEVLELVAPLLKTRVTNQFNAVYCEQALSNLEAKYKIVRELARMSVEHVYPTGSIVRTIRESMLQTI